MWTTASTRFVLSRKNRLFAGSPERAKRKVQIAQVIPMQLNTAAPLEKKSISFSIMVRSTCDEQTLPAVLKAAKHANAEQGADSRCC
ncbi:MAG: hypothetical protein GX267_14670 [Fibrobacter sp.]|nr:hypothetical protein [Fibrobacter sp.]